MGSRRSHEQRIKDQDWPTGNEASPRRRRSSAAGALSPATKGWYWDYRTDIYCGATKVRLMDLLALRRSLSTPTCPPSTPLDSYTGFLGPPPEL